MSGFGSCPLAGNQTAIPLQRGTPGPAGPGEPLSRSAPAAAERPFRGRPVPPSGPGSSACSLGRPRRAPAARIRPGSRPAVPGRSERCPALALPHGQPGTAQPGAGVPPSQVRLTPRPRLSGFPHTAPAYCLHCQHLWWQGPSSPLSPASHTMLLSARCHLAQLCRCPPLATAMGAPMHAN